ncbi:tetratricopeptide repeat protein, partial [Chloroflexus sp.]|uniref:tetratricopeptide repeat protein n=1 Tax=Chloroflexus sp. TaxID=1904827 RepID=UPI002ADE205A
MIAATNPYIAGKPVGKTPNFIGREDVLREVERFLHNPHQHALALYGQRRIGKTSILHHLEDTLPQRGNYVPIFFDLMARADTSLNGILNDLARTIADRLRLPDPVLDPPPARSFHTAFLPSVFAQIDKTKTLVLLLDEFDVLDNTQNPPTDFFAYLHELFRSDFPRLKFVFVLGRNIDDLSYFVYGLFKDVPSRRISFLSEQDTTTLVRLSERQGSLAWSDEAVHAVWQLTGGHPFLTQALCGEVWDAEYDQSDTPGPVQATAVENAITPTLDVNRHALEWIWNGLGPAEKVATAALAGLGQTIVDEEQLVAILNESGVRLVLRELREAPKKLQEWDILVSANGGYRFRVELLRRWIALNKPLSRTQEELDRIKPLADSLYNIARILYNDNKLPEAENELRRALRENPNHAGARELLAELLLLNNRWTEAQTELEALFDMVPGRAYSRLKQVYLERMKSATGVDQRRALIDRAWERLANDPDIRSEHHRLYQQLGADYEAQNRLTEALQAYEQAEDTPAQERIRTRIRQQAVQQALKELEQLRRQRDYATARARLQQLITDYPTDHDWQREQATLEQDIRLDELYRQALGAIQQEDWSSAKRLLTEVIALNPDYEEASRYLYWAVYRIDPQSELAQRDKTIARLEADLTQRDATIQQLQSNIAQRDKTIQQLRSDIAQRNETIQQLQSNIAQYESNVAGTVLVGSERRPEGVIPSSYTTPLGEITAVYPSSLNPNPFETQSNQTESSPPPPQLSRWNPLDGLRLLWWVLMKPALLNQYTAAYGDTSIRPIADRLAYLLALGPLLILSLGVSLGLMGTPSPASLEWLAEQQLTGLWQTQPWMPPIIMLLWFTCWLLNDWFDDRGLAGGVAFGVAGGVAGSVA